MNDRRTRRKILDGATRRLRHLLIPLAGVATLAPLTGTVAETDVGSDSLDSVLPYVLPDVDVTARRHQISEFQVGRAMSTVTRQEIARSGAGTTPDALSDETGVWIQKTNLGGGSPFIRGLTGKQVLLLIDGIRFNNATFRFGPNQYLNTTNPFTAARIEIVRGPGSVLYGSDALGGVLNILSETRDARDPPDAPLSDFRFFQQVSSADRARTTHAEFRDGNKKVAYALSGSYRKFGDLRAGAGDSPVGAVDTDGRQRPTAYRDAGYAASLEYAWSPRANQPDAGFTETSNAAPGT